MSHLNCWLSSAISSMMSNFLVYYSTTLLHVFLGLPIGLLTSTSSSIALLSMLFSSLHFPWWNHFKLIFFNLHSKFSTPHLLLSSSYVIHHQKEIILSSLKNYIFSQFTTVQNLTTCKTVSIETVMQHSIYEFEHMFIYCWTYQWYILINYGNDLRP